MSDEQEVVQEPRIQIGGGLSFKRSAIQHMLDRGYSPEEIFWDPEEADFYHQSAGVRGDSSWIMLPLILLSIGILIGAVIFIRELLR